MNQPYTMSICTKALCKLFGLRSAIVPKKKKEKERKCTCITFAYLSCINSYWQLHVHTSVRGVCECQLTDSGKYVWNWMQYKSSRRSACDKPVVYICIMRVLSFCVKCIVHYVPDYVQEAMHHAILQSRVMAVIIAITNWATILWILWRHTDSLYAFAWG